MKSILISTFLLISTSTFAVECKKDSLQKVLNKQLSDSMKFEICFELYVCFMEFNLDSAEKIVERAERISKKLSSPYFTATVMKMMGIVKHTKGKYQLADYWFKKGLQLLDSNSTSKTTERELGLQIDILIMLSNNFFSLGKNDSAHYFLSRARDLTELTKEKEKHYLHILSIEADFQTRYLNYENAIELYLKAHDYAKLMKDPRLISTTCTKLGMLFSNIGSHDHAKMYYQKALQNSNGSTQLVSILYNNYALDFRSEGLFDSALVYYYKALKINQKYRSVTRIGGSYCHIGSIFLEQNELDSAEKFLFKAYDIFTESQELTDLSVTLWHLGELHLKQGKIEDAKKYFKKTERLTYQTGDKDTQTFTFKKLSLIYFDQDSIKKAYRYLKNHDSYQDSILESGVINKAHELEANYQFAKRAHQLQLKEKELLLANNKKKTLHYQQIVLIGSISFLLIILTLLFLYRRKKRIACETIAMQTIENEKLKNEILTKDVQLKKEKLSYFSNQLKLKNTLIQELVKEEDIENSVQLIEVLQRKINTEKDWSDFLLYFEKTAPDFLKKLSSNYPNLTENEMRLSVLIRLNLSSKEISVLLNILPGSVKKAKQRLRKKIGIRPNESIEKFFLEI